MARGSRLEAHLFICTNEKADGPCCAARGGVELREAVKSAAKRNPAWKGRVRVNASGCLDRCEEGITAVLYPQGEWFVHLTPESAPELLDALARALDQKD